jgi:hypothetical protein
MKLTKALIGAALAAVTLAAFATVTFDPATGVGWVGKGDVQLAYGWNNKQMQDAEKNKLISFQWNAVDSYAGVCEWITDNGRVQKTHDVTHKKSTSVSWAVPSAARNNSSGKDGSNTGYYLTGYGGSVDTGTINGDAGLFAKYPLVLGGPCPGNNGTDGTWVEIIANTSSAGLYVLYQGANPKLLWDPAAPPVTTTTTTL